MSENTIVITEEQRKKINAYYGEARGLLAEIQAAQENLKDILSTVEESTNVKKALVSKYYKGRFKDELNKVSELAAVFEFLEEGQE